MNKRKDVIPNNLKEYRLKAGLTQKQVAEKLGFTNEVSLCHWEQGKNIPNLMNLIKLSILYKTQISNLYIELSKRLSNHL
jgi:transcriptional regulator with XRE-family HTH domain